MEVLQNFIGGRLEPPAAGRYLDVGEPATGRTYARVPDSDAADLERAVAAAVEAFPGWSRTPAGERSRCLLRMADILEAGLADLARAESIDTGKPVTLARTLDIPRAVQNLRFFATAVLHTRSEAHLTDHRALNYTLRRPRGVAGVISPWNLPLYLLTWKVAPALATGNTVVAKPSEITPVTAARLADAAREAGLPAGVLNIVHGTGPGAGAALVAHPAVPTISFTGGTATGAEIARSAAPLFKKVALEMGGKNPNVIFADADLDAALPEAVRASFTNQGQICLSGSRLLVQAPLVDTLLDRLVAGARALKLGDPLDEATEQGAMVSAAQHAKVMGYIEQARSAGGRILCGGGPPATLPRRCRGGHFIEPTVIAGLPPEHPVNREEVFGPVVSVLPFRDEDEAVAIANDTDYGLAASVWTRDLARAHRMAERIESGTVWINCWLLRDLRVPFGGMKRSGLGREGGEEALRFFTEPKNVCVRLSDAIRGGSEP